MCGIVGYVGARDALSVLLDGLRRLEYRGYDSAGVAILNGAGLESEKAPGKIAALEARINGRPLHGGMGIGHTRWATHGGVTRENAHPHFSCDGKIAVVHNGIVENYDSLRRQLTGHAFRSGTDTEVIPHLIEGLYNAYGGNLLKAVNAALAYVRGSFALGVLHADHPRRLVAARVNCPLVLGLGEGENFLASDLFALLPYTRRIVPLEEHEIAVLEDREVRVYDRDLGPKLRAPLEITWKAETALKGGYAHFMLKEIYEQKDTVSAEAAGREASLDGLDLPADLDRVIVVACGTAWHAGLVGKSALEEMAGIPVEVGLASELRYGDTPFGPRTLAVAISQSGETADTLAAVRMAKAAGAPVLAITNIRGSTLAREAERVLTMRAGLEIGVAATKTYTSQVLDMILLALHLGRARGKLTEEAARQLLEDIRRLPALVEAALATDPVVTECAERYARGYDFMYIGRRYNLATALEGALKMKEISYLHAEGYGAGEMKHGPLALVDERMVCVAIAPRGRVTEKMVSNIQEIRARQGKIIAVTTEGDALVRSVADHVIEIPASPEFLTPVTSIVPLQLLAYRTAVALGRDVDQPRNLAKSVTVE